MRRDRRDTLTTYDLELALIELNHAELIITPTGPYAPRD